MVERPRAFPLILLLTLLLVAVSLLHLSWDTTGWHSPWPENPLDARIFWQLNLPRLLLALSTGALLSWAGTLMQTLFRNPLADPGLIGVSAGAALSAVSLIALGLTAPLFQMSAAFAGALLTLALLYRLATRAGTTDLAWLLLAGIAFNAMASAGIGLSLYLSSNETLRLMTWWLMGSFAQAQWPTVLPALLLVGSLLGISLSQTRRLDRLLLGEQAAFHMGEDVQRLKRTLLLLIALAVGLSVATSGMISFVGLVAPHLARLLVGSLHHHLLPIALLMGMLLTLSADLLARLLLAPAELPVGLLLSALGGPFFFMLLMRLRHARG